MITNTNDMLKALKRETFCGVILYEGPSLIDGAPIVVIANRIASASGNEKTGAMVQTFIIRSDIHPLEALKTGADESVCGSCLARPAKENFCYVQVGKSVASVFGAYRRNRYARLGVDFVGDHIIPELFAGSIFRLGSYGDPAAAPFSIWQNATQHTKARNGYTHQWRNRPEFSALCMASCDTETDMHEAKASGWRCFRIRLATDPVVKGAEVVCPASAEGGFKTVCASCRACGGTSSKAKASVVIISHGPKAKRYGAWRAKVAA